jgi:hypothetical protein
MASPISSAPERQPKVVQRLLVRTLILVLALGALFLSLRAYLGARDDLGALETAETKDWIAAIEYKDEGQEIVAFKPDLEMVRTSDTTSDSIDRDFTWSPDGRFLFFVSDRKEDSFHVFRWNPNKTTPEMRTVGKRGRSGLSFAADAPRNQQNVLMSSGGIVVEFEPSSRRTTQQLPPVAREITMTEGEDAPGADSPFAQMYGSIGNSFRKVRWVAGRDYMAFVMGRDQGEVLVIQRMKAVDGKLDPPQPIAAGQKIDFDVNPQTGHIVYTVNGFQWPPGTPVPDEFVQEDGRLAVPFNHYISIWSPDQPLQPPIVATSDDAGSFGSPAIHPSGETVMVVYGAYENESIQPAGLLEFPIKNNAGDEGKPLVMGEVFEPAWHPNGQMMVYAKRDPQGKRSIFTARRDGSSERNISGGKGNFAHPRFSPQ